MATGDSMQALARMMGMQNSIGNYQGMGQAIGPAPMSDRDFQRMIQEKMKSMSDYANPNVGCANAQKTPEPEYDPILLLLED